MAEKTLASLAMVLAPLACPGAAPPPGNGKVQTEPFAYSQGFESARDPVKFWTSYNKKYTVHFSGVTDEKAYAGKRAYKLDVTFDEPSRFLWYIPIEKAVPVAGKLAFSGRMLLGEGTTGRATLGLSFRLPPSKYTGCTAPCMFYESTHGQWQSVGGDLVKRGREIANSVMARFDGVKGDLVGVYLERIILDLRGKAGQRVVLYVDDLEIRGEVPSDDAYREEVARRRAAAKQAFDATVASWERALSGTEQALAVLTDLTPQADAKRQVALRQLKSHKDMLDAMKKKGSATTSEQAEIGRFVEKAKGFAASARALSDAGLGGRPAVIYVVRPISAIEILPDDPFVLGKISQELSLRAARGEYEPASFVVSALSDVHSLTVTPEDLRNGRRVIPAANVDVKAVKCWYQAGTAWVSNRQDKSKRLLTPELLLNDDRLVKVDREKQENYLKLSFPKGPKYVWISDPTDVSGSKSIPVDKFPVKDSPVLLPVDIPAGANKQFWVTVKVPADAEPGTYTGRLALRTPDGTVGDLTLRMEVLPFKLLPPYYTSSIDNHGRLAPNDKGTIGSWLKSRQQFRAELTDMVAHGLRNCQHYGIKKSLLGEVLKIRREVGMDNRTLYLKGTIPIGNPTDPKALAQIKRDVRDIIDFTKAYGTKTVYFYGMDEARGEVLKSQRPAWKAVHEAGGKIFVAGYEENVDMMGDIQDLHVRAGWPHREEVEKWHALGHKIFCYANPQAGVENPVLYRRNYGLLLWKYDYDGAATNAYQHTFGATWNDFDHPVYRSHTIAYPTMNGVIDTIAWEGYREGVDDVRYVTTLQDAIRRAHKSHDATRRRAADGAEAYLCRLKAGTEIETGSLDSIRQEIIRHIEAVEGRATNGDWR